MVDQLKILRKKKWKDESMRDMEEIKVWLVGSTIVIGQNAVIGGALLYALAWSDLLIGLFDVCSLTYLVVLLACSIYISPIK